MGGSGASDKEGVGAADKGNSDSEESRSSISPEGTDENTIVQHMESWPTSEGRSHRDHVSKAELVSEGSTIYS